MARKRVPPSRLRYESSHPTVSFRVTTEERTKLEEMRKMLGLSLAEVVRRNLNLHEASTKEVYENGRQDGFGCFEIPCRVCRKPMKFDLKSPRDEKAREFLLKAFSTWGHTACLKKQGSGGD